VKETDWDWDTSDNRKTKGSSRDKSVDVTSDDSMDNIVPLYDPSTTKKKSYASGEALLKEKLLVHNPRQKRAKGGVFASIFGWGSSRGKDDTQQRSLGSPVVNSYVPPDPSAIPAPQQDPRPSSLHPPQAKCRTSGKSVDNEEERQRHSRSNRSSYSKLNSAEPSDPDDSDAVESPTLQKTKFSGYISMKTSKFLSSKGTYSSKYAVLQGSYFVYYNNQTDFEVNPTQPINKRAIDFSGMIV
jgi:hypothetical protein